MKKPPVKAQAGGTAAPKMDGKSSFLAAFKKSPKLAQKLKHVTDAKDPNAPPDIEEGTYAAKITEVRFGQYNNIPQATVMFVVTKGPAKGEILKRKYDFGKTSPNGPDEDEIFDKIGVDLKRLAVEIDEPTPEALLDAFTKIGEEKPDVQVYVKFSAKGYVNVYINRLLEPVAAEEGEPEGEEPEAGEAEPETDDEGGGDDGDDEGSETEGAEDDNEIPVEVEDLVKYTPPGSKKSVKCEVVKTDVKSKVCFLKTEDGTKTFKAVPWSSVEFVMEGE